MKDKRTYDKEFKLMAVYKLVAEQEIIPEGAKRNRTYELAKKK